MRAPNELIKDLRNQIGVTWYTQKQNDLLLESLAWLVENTQRKTLIEEEVIKENNG